MESRVKGFALHFTGRSGSTFLIYTLRKHPQVVARAEVFANKTLPGDMEQNADNQIAFLRKYWSKYKRSNLNGIDEFSRGFKVQIIKNNQQLAAVGRYVKVNGEYDVANLFLYRKNHVKQIVSSLRAAQVKALTKKLVNHERAHVYDDNLADQVRQLPKLTISPMEFKKRLISLRANYKILDDIKAKMGGGISLYYEDALNDRQAFFDKIFSEVGLSSIDVTESDETKKITSDNLEDVIENFNEIKDFFINTEYQDQFVE